MIRVNYLRPFLILVLIVFGYFALRFQNLKSLPVFGDEAIYIRWSQIIKNVETLRFIPQTDGKQPLFMWLNAASLKIIEDPVVSGRAVSVFAGFLTVVSLYIIGMLFFTPQTAYIAASLYVLLPFAFFFDRLALADSLLAAFGTLSLLFSLLLAKYRRLDLSLILGAILGISWLTKSPAIYFVILSFVTYIFYSKENLKTIYLPLLSAAIAFIIYNILRLGPQFHMIALRNRDYVWSLGEILKHPFDPLIPHLKDVFQIYPLYLSWSLIFLVIIGLILSIKKIIKIREIMLISLWWLLPLIANAAIAKVFTARYILFTLPPLILISAVILNEITNRLKKLQYSRFWIILTILMVTLPNLLVIKNISHSPYQFRTTSTETGYFSGWTSGWGIEETSKYLIDRAREANVIVGTEGYFGTLPDGLQIFTDGTSQLTVFGVGIDITSVPEKLIDARKHGDEVYLLFNRSRLKLPQNEMAVLTLISSYRKPDGDELILLRLN